MNDLFAPPVASLAALRREETGCQRCDLYRDATQVVPGEGEANVALMLVGEQPGDRKISPESFRRSGRGVLDRALAEAGIRRGDVYVTNAVKHFKYEWHGDRRLHMCPDAGEIEACRWWLDIERALVRPGVIVALGATAGRGVLGRAVTICKARVARDFVTRHFATSIQSPRPIGARQATGSCNKTKASKYTNFARSTNSCRNNNM